MATAVEKAVILNQTLDNKPKPIKKKRNKLMKILNVKRLAMVLNIN